MNQGGLLRLVLPVLLLGLIVLATVLGSFSGTRELPGSAFSPEASGRRAALLLLDRLGFDAAPWTREPGHLEGNGVLLLADVPPEPAGYPEPDASGAGATTERRLRDRRHYLRFVEEGGTLVAHADPDLVDFLAQDLELDEFADLAQHEDGIGEEAFLGSGEVLDIAWPHFPVPDERDQLEMLLADEDERPLTLSLQVGRGRVVLLSTTEDPFDNAQLPQDQHALFLVRLAERFAGTRPVRFDDYALGLWTPTSPLQLALGPRALLLSLHLLLFVVLLVWSAAWVRAFPRDPRPLERTSPVERARGFAGLLARHRRFDLLGRALQRGVFRRLARRVGRRERDEEGSVHTPLERDQVEAVLTPLLRHVADDDRRQRAHTLLLGQLDRRSSSEALEELARELDDLERMCLGGATREVDASQLAKMPAP